MVCQVNGVEILSSEIERFYLLTNIWQKIVKMKRRFLFWKLKTEALVWVTERNRLHCFLFQVGSFVEFFGCMR